MPAAASIPWFPLRAVLGFLLGFAVVVGASHLLRHDPTADLVAASYPPAVVAPLEHLPPRAPGATRIFVVGASETMGYPYEAALDASYATLLGDGLKAVLPGAAVEVHVAASTALDSQRLAELVARLARLGPSAFVVTLGNNEYSNRIVAGRALDPDDLLGRYADRASRARAFWARLPLPKDPLRAQRVEAANVDALPARVKDARPAEPALPGLPVGTRDQQRLELRLRRNLEAMVAAARAHGARVVFAIAPYNLAATWPFGMCERDAAADALVVRAQRGAAVELAEVDGLLRDRPDRADLHFLRGRLLRARGEAGAARQEFARARDLDPAPLHATGGIDATIVLTARDLGVPCLRLEQAITDPDGLPANARFLDHAHLDLDGHRALAQRLAQELAALGIVPSLGAGFEPAFAAAAAARQARVAEDSRNLARMRTAWTQATLMLLCGNFRDALFPMRDAMAEMARPENRAFGQNQLPTSAQQFLFALFAEAGRLAENSAPVRRDQWLRQLREELDHGRGPDRIIDEVLR